MRKDLSGEQMSLVQHNDDTILKLKNAAIERSKFVDSAVIGKYSI